MNQLTSVVQVVWVCVCQILMMASIMAKREEVAKMVPNLMVSVAMLFAKRQLDLPDKWKLLGENWVGKMHFAVAIVGAPMQTVMVFSCSITSAHEMHVNFEQCGAPFTRLRSNTKW